MYPSTSRQITPFVVAYLSFYTHHLKYHFLGVNVLSESVLVPSIIIVSTSYADNQRL